MKPIVVTNPVQSKNDTNSDEIQIGSDSNENSRQTRQLNPGGWTPIPAVWSPRPRSPLNTWWALPWPFENGQSFVRVQPPSPYWQDYRHHEEHHHHHHVSIKNPLVLKIWSKYENIRVSLHFHEKVLAMNITFGIILLYCI